MCSEADAVHGAEGAPAEQLLHVHLTNSQFTVDAQLCKHISTTGKCILTVESASFERKKQRDVFFGTENALCESSPPVVPFTGT